MHHINEIIFQIKGVLGLQSSLNLQLPFYMYTSTNNNIYSKLVINNIHNHILSLGNEIRCKILERGEIEIFFY